MSQKPRFELLDKHHDRSSFDCGIDELNKYIRMQARQEADRNVSSTYIMIGNKTSEIAGYYSLSAFSINAGELPEDLLKKMPRYPQLPATLLGRLAVNLPFQGKGYGQILLMDALDRVCKNSKQIGSIALVVDAIDEKAKAFYQHFQFIPLIQYPKKLFLPIAKIKDYFSA